MIKKNKVLLVSNSSWSILNFRLSLIKHLKKNNFIVITCSIHDDKYQKKLEEDTDFYSFNSNKNFRISFINEFYIFIKFILLLKRTKPSICLFYTSKPNIIFSICTSILRIKYINNITGLGSIFLKKNEVIKFLFKILYKVSLYKSNCVFFQNNDDYNFFIKNKLTKTINSKVIPGSGINIELKNFYKPKKKNKDLKVFLCLSRLIKDKGIYEFIDASKIINNKYNNVIFKLIGDTDYNNPSSIKFSDLEYSLSKSKITYENFKENIYEEINECDCLILPSYREGLSRTLLEAGILKKPSITSNVPGCKDVIQHNYNGLICEPKNASDLANKIEIFINMDDKKINQMGTNALENVLNKFDEKLIFNQYIETINNEL